MPEKVNKRGLRGPSKEHTLGLSDSELALVAACAEQYGITLDEAVEKLASDALAKRVRKRTGKRPSSSVLRFRK